MVSLGKTVYPLTLFGNFLHYRLKPKVCSPNYQFLVIPDRFSLPVERVWERDCPELDEEFDWHDVWSDISQVSRNPDHQQIHYNFIHRTYLTPVRLHYMKFVNDPLCTLCSLKVQGTYLHMIWDCPPARLFWNKVASKWSTLTDVTVPVTVKTLILNDLSTLKLSKIQKRAVFAGLTAAKKMIATRWKPAHSMSIKPFPFWTLYTWNCQQLEFHLHLVI